MTNYNMKTDQELTGLLRVGDESAFLELYNRYKFRITGNLMKLLKSEDLVEELLQDLFLKLWDTRAQLDPEKSFRSYLFKISENMVMDVFRKAARDKRMQVKLMSAQTETYSHIEEKIFSDQDNSLLQQAIDKLPPQRKQVFMLCKIEGKSYKEVSELLGISASTINDHLLKANRFLKQQLNPPSGFAVAIIAGAILHGI